MSINSSEDQIKLSKDKFNDFFLHYLYGYFENDDNIILSRGIWEDNFITYPDIFKFAINLSIDNQWNGYSDSLGHDNVFEELLSLSNINGDLYTTNNTALTLGNVTGLSFVFLHLSKQLKLEGIDKGNLLSISPFYPSILDSAKNYFNVDTIDSFKLSEQDLLVSIKNKVEQGYIHSFLIPNFIGVDGRTYSKEFFFELIDYLKSKGIHLIIDELTWYDPLSYPDNINSDNVIRMVSLSKMYGIPGMKLGFMLGSEDFIKGYYNTASSGYGGPASNFFLLQEFIYLFEKNRLQGNQKLDQIDIDNILYKYNINSHTLINLYRNYLEVLESNYKKFQENYELVKQWAFENQDYFNYYNLNQEKPAINTIFELKGVNDFSFFVSLIYLFKVSIFPGTCIGYKSDNIFRINFLEDQKKLQSGLSSISELLSKYKKNISDRIKLILVDKNSLYLFRDIEKMKEILGFKDIKLGILSLDIDESVGSHLISTNMALKSVLLSSNDRDSLNQLVQDLIDELLIGRNNILYIGNMPVIDIRDMHYFTSNDIESIDGNNGGIDSLILYET